MSETVAEVIEAQTPVTAPIPPEFTPNPAPIARGKAWLMEKDRTMNLKGKAYLQVADRVYAFRLDYPPESGWQIVTTPVEGSVSEKFVVWKAEVISPQGVVIATGQKVESPPSSSMGCQDWWEKGETGAIGRAIGLCGYGTCAALEEDPDRPCDAPRERTQQSYPSPARPQQQRPEPTAAPKPKAPEPADDTTPSPACVVCGKPVSPPGRVKFCEAKALPPSCADKACSTDEKAKAKKG